MKFTAAPSLTPPTLRAISRTRFFFSSPSFQRSLSMPGLENEKPRRSCFCFSALPLNPEVTFFRSWLFSWRVRGLGKKELRFQLKDIYSVALLGDFFYLRLNSVASSPRSRRAVRGRAICLIFFEFISVPLERYLILEGLFFIRVRFSWRRGAKKKKNIFSIEGWSARRKGDLINDCLLI